METKSKEVDELKLSKYSLKLCKEVQMALPHISNVRAMKRLAGASKTVIPFFVLLMSTELIKASVIVS